LPDVGWFHTDEPSGSQEVRRGPRRRSAVGASGRVVPGLLGRPIPRLEPIPLRASECGQLPLP
jgi:hypothetical protein